MNDNTPHPDEGKRPAAPADPVSAETLAQRHGREVDPCVAWMVERQRELVRDA